MEGQTPAGEEHQYLGARTPSLSANASCAEPVERALADRLLPLQEGQTGRRLRIFFVEGDPDNLRVSISKKNFKLAVDRNKIKRQIKETFRINNLFSEKGCFVVIVYKDYFNDAGESPSVEIIKAVESSNH